MVFLNHLCIHSLQHCLICSVDTCQLPSLSRLADNLILALDADLPERIQSGTEVKFGCTDGFALTKGGVLTCGDDGIWQGVLPECARRLSFESFYHIHIQSFKHLIHVLILFATLFDKVSMTKR